MFLHQPFKGLAALKTSGKAFFEDKRPTSAGRSEGSQLEV